MSQTDTPLRKTLKSSQWLGRPSWSGLPTLHLEPFFASFTLFGPSVFLAIPWTYHTYPHFTSATLTASLLSSESRKPCSSASCQILFSENFLYNPTRNSIFPAAYPSLVPLIYFIFSQPANVTAWHTIQFVCYLHCLTRTLTSWKQK